MIPHSVFKPADRPNWVVQFEHPRTGRRAKRSTGQTTRRAAERWAARYLAELEAGSDPHAAATWEQFIVDHPRLAIPGATAGTASMYRSSFRRLATAVQPRTLADVSTAALERWVAGMLAEPDLSAATAAAYLRHVMAALRWAHKRGDLPALPTAPKLDKAARKASRRAKGRPPTGEEFERMLACCDVGGGAEHAESWRAFLRGLYWGGLRLSEALRLRWDQADGSMRLRTEPGPPVLIVPADGEKAGRDRVIPVAPEWTPHLPPQGADGFVFHPHGQRQVIRKKESASERVRAIGEAAGVQTNTRASGKPHWCGAHDLRRAFGTRWAARLSPSDLTALMRHKDVSTSMDFYVHHDAADLAGRLTAAMGADSATIPATGGDSEGV